MLRSHGSTSFAGKHPEVGFRTEVIKRLPYCVPEGTVDSKIKKQRRSHPVVPKFPTEEIPTKGRNFPITPSVQQADHVGGRPYRRAGELRSRAYSAACR